MLKIYISLLFITIINLTFPSLAKAQTQATPTLDLSGLPRLQVTLPPAPLRATASPTPVPTLTPAPTVDAMTEADEAAPTPTPRIIVVTVQPVPQAVQESLVKVEGRVCSSVLPQAYCQDGVTTPIADAEVYYNGEGGAIKVERVDAGGQFSIYALRGSRISVRPLSGVFSGQTEAEASARVDFVLVPSIAIQTASSEEAVALPFGLLLAAQALLVAAFIILAILTLREMRASRSNDEMAYINLSQFYAFSNDDKTNAAIIAELLRYAGVNLPHGGGYGIQFIKVDGEEVIFKVGESADAPTIASLRSLAEAKRIAQQTKEGVKRRYIDGLTAKMISNSLNSILFYRGIPLRVNPEAWAVIT